MKNILHLCIKNTVIFLIVFLFIQNSFAQTSLNVYSLDSTYLYCPAPVNPYFQLYGTTDGYNCSTDVLNVDIYYGDGSVGNFTCPLSYYTGTFCSFSFYDASHTYSLPGTYNAMMIVTAPDGNDDTVFHTVYISNMCGNVSGYTYIDNNSNCIYDTGDDVASGYPLDVYYVGTYVTTFYSDINGFYSMSLPSGSTFTVQTSPGTFSGLTNTCPVSGSYTFTVGGSPITNNYGFECPTTGFDLHTTGDAWGLTPGNTAYFWVEAGNGTCLPTNATITLNFDPHLTYSGTYYGPAPSTVSATSLVWNASALSTYGMYGYYSLYQFFSEISFLTDTLVTVGDTLCFDLTVTPTLGDLDVTNNSYSFCTPVLASWDPNMKVVQQGKGATGNIEPNSTLDYTIHFQNTGNFPATNIFVLDTLDNNLDFSTLEILCSSHAMSPVIIGGNIIKFDFPNINLPDSTNNEPLSHGWVKYRINTKTGLSNGTQITNTAHIFFDYNPAVVTNTTLNTIDISLSITDNELNKQNTIHIFPNPATEFLNLITDLEGPKTLLLFDLYGRKVAESKITQNNNIQIDISNLPNGCYSVYVIGKSTLQVQLVVSK